MLRASSLWVAVTVLSLGCGPGVDVDDDATSGGSSSTSTTEASTTTAANTTVVTTVATSSTTDPGGTTGGIVKGVVDEGALTSGVTVTLTPDGLGTLVVPMSAPIPDVPREDLQSEMLTSVAVLVTSNQSGASADLMAGFVEAALANPGAYDWELDADRTAVTMTFVNETPGGLVLTSDSTYTGQMALTTNDYIERVSAIAFQVTVVQQ